MKKSLVAPPGLYRAIRPLKNDIFYDLIKRKKIEIIEHQNGYVVIHLLGDDFDEYDCSAEDLMREVEYDARLYAADPSGRSLLRLKQSDPALADIQLEAFENQQEQARGEKTSMDSGANNYANA